MDITKAFDFQKGREVTHFHETIGALDGCWFMKGKTYTMLLAKLFLFIYYPQCERPKQKIQGLLSGGGSKKPSRPC